MTQMTWRAPDELLSRVRRAARAGGRSMNEYVTAVLDAATDPELAGNEAERVRERLRAAGLLADTGAERLPPDEQLVEQARAAAGRGTRLSDIVSEQRK